AGDEVARERRALEYERQRSGPESRGELARGLGNFARPRERALSVRKVHDHRMLHRAALHRVEKRDCGRIGCVGAQAVDGFGGKCDQTAGAQDLRRAPDFVVHSLSGAALSTLSVCLRRNSSSFAARPASESASTATAKSAALAAPASPIANVPTGMPLGICTVESSESSPCRCLEGIGTPSTGSVLCAATTPARCAAPPAAAMIAFMPFFCAPEAHSATACGVRCADMAFASYGTPNSSSIFAAAFMVSQSEAEPITMPIMKVS